MPEQGATVTTHKNNARSFLTLPFFAKSQPPKKNDKPIKPAVHTADTQK